MSLWPARRLRIVLHRDRAELIRLGRGRPSAVLAGTVAPGPVTGDWQALLAALGETLKQAAWQGSRLQFVLSHHWCRLSLVPGGLLFQSLSEEERFVRLRMAEDNGELPEHWTVTVAGGSYRNPRVACAVDGGLIRAIDAVASAAKCRVTSVQPLFAVSYNAKRRDIGMRHAWFVTVEPERCCVARIDRGHWRSVRLRRLFGDMDAEVAALIDQERLLSDGDELPAEVFFADAAVALERRA